MKSKFLSGMSHNGKVVFFTEPFWAVPFNMFSLFLTLYMLDQGITERQIGLIQSGLVLSQIISSYYSGMITDRLGRKRTTLLFDSISWGAASLVWAFSGTFFMFFAAALLNGINKFVYVSFQCLLSEDATSGQRIRNYSGLHLMVLAGGLAAPLGGLVISFFGLSTGMRIMYGVSSVLMPVMFVIRHILWNEPSSHERNSMSPLKAIGELMVFLRTNGQARTAFLLQSVNQFVIIFKPVFYFAFIKKVLLIDEKIFSFIPPVMSVITIMVLFFLLPRVSHTRRPFYILTGLLTSALSALFLILSVRYGLVLVLISVLLDGLGSSLIRPLIDSFWADCLDSRKRASQLGAGNFIIGLLTVPAGILAAELYQLQPVLPFLFVSGLLFIVFTVFYLHMRVFHKS